MKAIVVVGLGFGDCGKGSVVDAYVRKYNASLVVRYSGGCQCGHRVVTADGESHVFSQFGAGTFAGALTHLSSHVIISPPAMRAEAAALEQLGFASFGQFSVHPQALVTTPYAKFANRFAEARRNPQYRHGTCGLGIGETRRYWLENGDDAIFAGDLRDHRTLCEKLYLQRERVKVKISEGSLDDEDDRSELIDEYGDVFDKSVERVADELALPDLDYRDDPFSRLHPDSVVVFEGAQGVLLDEYHGFHPHTTWSTVTSQQAHELISETSRITWSYTVGVTRCYSTRHGAGPMANENPLLKPWLREAANSDHGAQGIFRVGYLDPRLLHHAVVCDSRIDGLFVNHLDDAPKFGFRTARPTAMLPVQRIPKRKETLAVTTQTESWPDEGRMLEAINQFTNLPIVGKGRGPTAGDKELQDILLDI